MKEICFSKKSVFPRITEEVIEMENYIYTLSQNAGNTLGIRWPYANHTIAIRK